MGWGYKDKVGIDKSSASCSCSMSPEEVTHILTTDGQNLSLSVNDAVVSSVTLEDKYIQDIQYDKDNKDILFKLDDNDVKKLNVEEIFDSEFASLTKEEIKDIYNQVAPKR